MNHVSVSPTDGNGPTQGQRKTLTRVGIEPPPLHRLSHKVRREQVVGSEDVKVTGKGYVYTNVDRVAPIFF